MAATSSFKIQCPSCETSVTIKNASLVGKKIDCPKCKYRFLVEAPADLESEDDDDDKKDKDGKDAKKKGDKSKKGKKSSGDDEGGSGKKKNTTLMIGIGLGGLAIILLGAALFGGIFDDEPAKPTNNNPPSPQPVAKGPDPEPAKKENTPPPPVSTYKPGINREISNLLPNNSQWVLSVDGPGLLGTSPGTLLFDATKPTTFLVKDSLGFPVDTISQVISAGGDEGRWSFSIIRTRTEFKIDAVKSALEVTDPTKTIRNRDYFVVKDNPLFTSIGGYVSSKLSELNFKLQTPADRVLTACIVDTRTLIVADEQAMEQFLQADGLPTYLSNITTAPAPDPKVTPGTPGSNPPATIPGAGMVGMPPMGATGSPAGRPPAGMAGMPPMGSPGTMTPPAGMAGMPPMGSPGTTPPAGMAGMPPVGMAGMPPIGPGMPPGTGTTPAPKTGTPTGVFTSNATFRTIDPALKAMLNRMELERKPVVNMAIRLKTSGLISAIAGGGKLFGGSFRAFIPPGAKFGDAIPDSVVVGVALNEFTSSKMNLQISTDLDIEEQAREVQNLLKLFMPTIASELSKEVGFIVKSSEGDPNQNNGQFGQPGFPGQPPGMIPGSPGITPGLIGPPGGKANRGQQPPKVRTPFQGGTQPGVPPGFPGGMNPPGFPPGGPGMVPGSPGGPGMVPGQPGFPGGTPVDENKSTVTLGRQDRTISITIDLDWKKEYPNGVAADLRTYFDSVAGQALLMGLRHPWHKLPSGFAKIQATGKFPRAAYNRRSTAARMGLPYAPEQRLSWMTELLPSLGYNLLYGTLEKDQGWNNPTNLGVGRAWIPEFIDATQPQATWRAKLSSVAGKDLGATHFVGISGIGDDAADLPNTPENAKRLGIFGYDRETSFAEVQNGDGLSNTMVMAQIAPNIARPWIRGGGATVAGIPEKESLRPFSVLHGGGEVGTYVLMADGSVRFVKQSADANVFKAMATYKGGEKLDNLDAVATKLEVTSSKLKTTPINPPKKAEPLPVVPDNIPKGWQSVPVRVVGSNFGIGLPSAKIEALAERPDEKSYQCKLGNLSYTVNAVYKGYNASEMTEQMSKDEVARFAEKNGLKVEGDPKEAALIGKSKGWDFRTKALDGVSKVQSLNRLWLVNGTRLLLTVSGESEIKAEDAEPFFKSIALEGTTPLPERKSPKWTEISSLKLGFRFLLPSEPNVFESGDSVTFAWPKDLEGGATLSVSVQPFKFTSPDEPAKVKSDLEQAALKGTFGELFKGQAVRVEADKDREGKPLLTANVHRGDSQYRTQIHVLNRDKVVILAVRFNNTTIPAQEFFQGFQYGVSKPKDKDGNTPGTPGTPGMNPMPAAPGTNPVPPVPGTNPKGPTETPPKGRTETNPKTETPKNN